MSYISCFSGIGGLEGSTPPMAVCDTDPHCQTILDRRFSKAKMFADVRSMDGVKSDLVVGGWPCQDLSIAGKQRGLAGTNSRLFYDFVNVAVTAGAETIVAENVPNLLRLQGGLVFMEVLRELTAAGFPQIAWRTINARQFGLPHHRKRVFIVASKQARNCSTLFRPIPPITQHKTNKAAGFYWTAGIHSICYSAGYVPTLKIGSSKSTPVISPPAVHFGDYVRLLTADEALSLQGFNPEIFYGIPDHAKYRMAGNAVASPVGRFVVDGVLLGLETDFQIDLSQDSLFGPAEHFGRIPEVGFWSGSVSSVHTAKPALLATNLADFLDLTNTQRLNVRQASGLLRRLDRSGKRCPDDLRLALEHSANEAAVE